MSSLKIIVIHVFLIVCIYFGSRAPFYGQILFGEEGSFARILTDNPPAPDYLLIARVNQTEIFIPPLYHSGTLYKLLSIIGTPYRIARDYINLSEDQKITFLRILASLPLLFSLLAIYFLYFLFFGKTNLSLVLYTLVCLSLTPLALTSSIELQLDGGVGILLVIIAVLPYLFNIRSQHFLRFFIFALSGWFLGLGKLEWNIIFSIAILSMLTYTYLNRYVFPSYIKVHESFPLHTSESWKSFESKLYFSFLGMLLGNLTSFLLDPTNYLGCFHFLFNTSTGNSIFSMDSILRFLSMTKRRIDFEYIFVFLIPIFFALFMNRKAIKNEFWFILIFGLGLFSAFALNSMNFWPRYFAPALIIFTLIFVFSIPFFKKSMMYLSIIFLTFSLLHGINFAYFIFVEKKSMATWVKIVKLDQDFLKYVPSTNSCVPYMPVGPVWLPSAPDFVSHSLDVNGAKQIISKFNKPLCNDDFILEK